MINAEKLLAQHRRAECVLLLIQKADAKIQAYKKQIEEYDYIKSFYNLRDFERWLACTQAAKERLIETYNKIKL